MVIHIQAPVLPVHIHIDCWGKACMVHRSIKVGHGFSISLDTDFIQFFSPKPAALAAHHVKIPMRYLLLHICKGTH